MIDSCGLRQPQLLVKAHGTGEGRVAQHLGPFDYFLGTDPAGRIRTSIGAAVKTASTSPTTGKLAKTV